MIKLLNALENRLDLNIIADWIETGSTVLDVGCGDGTLLQYLVQNKGVKGMGVEIDLKRIVASIEKGIPVIEHDLNKKFVEISDGTYDYVILSQTIQEVYHPDQLIDEILRIGKYGIVSFPNFGYYKPRLELFLRGRMPKTKSLPFEWYDTPNIHLMTISDFENFCNKRGIKILKTVHISGNRYRKSMLFPNLLSEGCVALISR